MLLWIAAALTLITGWDYFRKALPYLRSEGRPMIDVLYFAWVRERIGLPREAVETSAATVADLVDELKAREAALRGGLCRRRRRCAWRWTRSWPISTRRLKGVREVAFFPPMTGG